ncbi:SDR family NAD(P)-dependent oxidoreductase [Halosimplex rubrum]|uniref:SDR family NAD(P)-dependent oxidoreductase n=1 Tax=Halosimplex rubrum TaxID=869889 RepID=A0A7D5P3T7_9EURY|nr:SDR family NAD(P)-dependent oxidoreductase [Halosimplex rubrum]QLH76822.1 SDR family NAD(P)-dependent oxidoreductase [Halosimplex rubrum]
MIDGRNVLLTGGAGSVGRILIPRLLDQGPEVLRIFDNNEPGLASLKAEFGDDRRCRFLSGDVREKDRLERAMEGIDVVIHTAAMKHVDVCEYNPFEAVKTNTLGLQNVVDTAIDATVQRVVFTSSDKAVNPANTMGTTKLLGERLITAGNKHRGRSDLRLASVRFGNVLNSSHSVVPLFERQIRDGGPVELTDRRMTRFFLTHDDLFELVTGALELTNGGEVFLAKMSAIRIEDLATAMVETAAPKYGQDPEDIEIDIVGKRPGETFHEEIMTPRERDRVIENENLYAIPPESGGYFSYEKIESFEPASDVVRSSEDAETLPKDEIVDLLKANGGLRA